MKIKVIGYGVLVAASWIPGLVMASMAQNEAQQILATVFGIGMSAAIDLVMINILYDPGAH